MAEQSEKIFVIPRLGTRDLETFEAFCKLMTRWKAHGRVQIDVSTQPDLLQHEMPKKRSPWHDYTSQLSTLFNIFPHPKIAPHLSQEMVRKNREMLLAKTAILRKYGFEAFFHGQDPHFLPESFFRQHPHLRGPRVDHPRRSAQEEFSLCTDLDETLEMYSWMMTQFKRQVPELATYEFNTNDAGGGFCWAAALYSGPNGPRHCQGRTAGQRVRGFVEALNRGAEAGGSKIDIRLAHANFWQNEREVIRPLLPPNATMAHGIALDGPFGMNYPVLGLVDPLATLAAMEHYGDARWIDLGVGASYNRGHDLLEAAEKICDIAEDAIREPAAGFMPRLAKLRQLCVRWGGEENADKLAEAFFAISDSQRVARMLASHFSAIYCGLSMRFMTRPLVFRPEALKPEEESYFLPYVFNPSENEARCDYLDWHGGRFSINAAADELCLPPFLEAVDRMRGAAATLDSATDAPQAAWLKQVAQAARVWASIMRSCHNFYFGQIIRDRNRAAIAAGPTVPPKAATWSGHPDLLPWNALLRDEFDNAEELLSVLQNGGLSAVWRAKEARDETTFLFGPDLIGALKKKLDIMRAHWLDVEQYLATPHK